MICGAVVTKGLRRFLPRGDMEADRLLSVLGQALGQPLAFDDSGQCALGFSDDRTLVIAAVDETLTSLRVDLAQVERGPAGLDLLRRALALNYRAARPGISIGLCEASSTLALLAFAEGGTDEELVEAVTSLLEDALEVRQALADGGPLPTAGNAASMMAPGPVAWLRG